MPIIVPIISTFQPAGVDKASKSFNDLEGLGAQAGYAINKSFLPAVAAIGALGLALTDSVKAAIEDQAAQDSLARQLATSTGATSAAIKANEEWISATSRATSVADDKLRPALATLVRATKDVTESQKLLGLAQDISARTGKDLEAVSTALAKASLGNVSALTKLGVPLSANTKKTNDFHAATKELSATFEGSAKAAANTAEGRMRGLSISIQETQESIGAALLPALQKVLPYLQSFAAWAEKNTKVILIAAGAIATMAGAIVAINAGLKIYSVVTKAAAIAQSVFNAVLKANPYVKVALIIGTVVSALVVLYKTSDTVRNGFQTLAGGVVTAINYIVGATGRLLQGVTNFAAAFLQTVSNLVGKLSWVPGLGDKFKGISGDIARASIAVKDFGKNFEELKLPSFKGVGSFATNLKSSVSKSFGSVGNSAGDAFVTGAADTISADAASSSGKVASATKKQSDAAKKAVETLKKKVEAAANATKQAIEAAQGRIADAFGRYSGKALQAYDAETSRLQQSISDDLTSRVLELDQQLRANLERVAADLSTRLAGLSLQEQALTPGEIAYKEAQALRDQELAARDLARAEADLNKARKANDAEAIAEAEQHLADIRTERQISALRDAADIERKAATERFAELRANAEAEAAFEEKMLTATAEREKSAADKQAAERTKQLDARRQLQRENLEDELADLEKNLEQRKTSWTTAHEKLMGLFKDVFGPDYALAGANLGSAFADGIIAAEVKARNAVTALGNIVPGGGLSLSPLPSPSASGSGTITVNVNAAPLGVTAATVGQGVVDALKAWQTRNGVVPIRTA